MTFYIYDRHGDVVEARIVELGAAPAPAARAGDDITRIRDGFPIAQDRGRVELIAAPARPAEVETDLLLCATIASLTRPAEVETVRHRDATPARPAEVETTVAPDATPARSAKIETGRIATAQLDLFAMLARSAQIEPSDRRPSTENRGV